MSVEPRLEDLRREIDQLDQQLVELVNARARIAQQIGTIKQQSAQGSELPLFYRPEREAQVLRKVMALNPGPLPDQAVGHLFRELMSSCLALEQVLPVVYLGPEGTFTHQAALKQFGAAIHAQPLRSIEDVFTAVESGDATFGVVPVENSTEGAVNHTLDLLIQSPLRICGEVQVRIHQNLISEAAELGQIGTIYSHAQSLAQCRKWITMNLPAARLESVSSNADAVLRAKNNPRSAAIAGKMAALHHGVPIMHPNIEDGANNTTRFLVLGTQEIPPSGCDKTSLLISANDRPGMLLHLIKPLEKHKVMMNRLDARPSRRSLWDYIFFIDIEGHQTDPHVMHALEEMRMQATLFRVLGSFPQAAL